MKATSRFYMFIGLFLVFNMLASPALGGPDDSVTLAIERDVESVNVLETKILVDTLLTFCMHEILMGTDPVTGEYTLGLAKTATVMPGGKDVKFVLYKDRFFHTGDPVTAHDVKWSYRQAAAPENAHLLAGMIEEIEDIEVIDDHTLVFHFYERYAPWRALLWLGICSEKYFNKVGWESFREAPVGSGPFRFVSRDRGERIILEAFDRYLIREPIYNAAKTKIVRENAVKRKVDFKTLNLRVVPDAMTRIAMLKTGEVDVIFNIQPQHVTALERDEKIKVKRTSRIPSYFGLAVSPIQYPIMGDEKFVRGLNHAINRQEMVDKIFLGEGFPLYMYASKIELGHDPTYKIEYNPVKARTLIDESSYKKGEVILLTYTRGLQNANLVAEVIQKYLTDVGVEVKLQGIEYGTFATYIRNRDKRVGHLSLYHWPSGKDPHQRLMLSQMSGSVYSTHPNRPSQAKVDKLVLAQSKETNRNKRLKILAQLHSIINKEPASISLYGLNQIYAMRDRIDYTWGANSYPYNIYLLRVMK